MRIAIALRCAAGVAAVALALGCGVIPVGTETDEPIDRVDRTAMAEDERFAVNATEGYWRRHFTELFGKPYTSPRVAGGYLGSDGPRCGDEPSVPFNAFYCLPGDFLAWDENLMAAGYDQIGDAWVYLIIAHEWAHAIQARLDRYRVLVAVELQADCLAGATLTGAARDGLIVIEPGDPQEIAQTLIAVSDDYPWTSERDHGNAQQRISAFNAGAAGGVTACA